MTKNSSSMGNILFRIFWWVVQHLNLSWAHSLMYLGLKDGAFPRQPKHDPQLAVQLWGHQFSSPFGLGEGIDKQGNILDELIYMGFSFGEFGPFTLEREMPDTKTLFLKPQKAMLVQSLAYRNPGIIKILPNLVKRRYLPHYVGVNLAVPAESEEQNIKQGRHFTYVDEFVLMSQKVAPYCDYIVLNLSHPNSELSTLVVDGPSIKPIIQRVKEAVRLAAPIQTPPVFVKIPLDVNLQEIPLIVNYLMEVQVDGVIVAGPLSVGRNSSFQLNAKGEYQTGMLFGQPVCEKVLDLIRHIYQQSNGQLKIISCGGVFSAQDAFNNLRAGASLIQLDESALVYNSPSLIFSLQKGLLELMTKQGYPSVDKLIGAEHIKLEEPVQPVQSTATPVQSTTSVQPVSTPVQPTSASVQATTPSVQPNPTVNVPPQQTF